MPARFFNTAGPANAEDHYCLPPLERFALSNILSLIEQKKYCVLHAPRQTGKTSALLALMAYLNERGQYRCVYMNVEAAQAAREDVAAAMQAIRGELVSWSRTIFNETLVDDIWDEALHKYGPYGVFGQVLSQWAGRDAKPLVVLIDEIDALVGDTLISVLRQLRAGYARRPAHFPHSVVLCGVRDVRDYRIHSAAEKAIITGGSAFNVKAESLRLADKLQEGRVQRVIEPLLTGTSLAEEFHTDDVAYVVDLGLVSQSSSGELTIANPIYREVIPRELAWNIQSGMAEQTSWYVTADGRLDMVQLLSAFQEFFREHSEHWVERFQYKEAGPQLLLQAFLQRIVNGGGRIEREYGLGRMRTDLLVIWPQADRTQRIVIECKLLHKSLEQTIAAGLEQTWAYMDRCGTREGHLVIFDRTPEKPWEDKLFHRQETVRERGVHIWGM